MVRASFGHFNLRVASSATHFSIPRRAAQTARLGDDRVSRRREVLRDANRECRSFRRILVIIKLMGFDRQSP
jgi:hypothetical protein